MNKTVNHITNFLGFCCIIAALLLAYEKESFGGWDIFLTVVAGMILIWFKNDAAREVIDKIISRYEKK